MGDLFRSWTALMAGILSYGYANGYCGRLYSSRFQDFRRGGAFGVSSIPWLVGCVRLCEEMAHDFCRQTQRPRNELPAPLLSAHSVMRIQGPVSRHAEASKQCRRESARDQRKRILRVRQVLIVGAFYQNPHGIELSSQIRN